MDNCTGISFDNRETCTLLLPSSCIPYTGYVSPLFTAQTFVPVFPCRPNVNDILKSIQVLLERIKASLGDNTTLDNDCLTFDPATATQAQINQELITEICLLKDALAALPTTIDPSTIVLAIDLLCLIDPACTPATTYTLEEILIKLVAAYCNLLTRVQNIETILNI